MHMHTEFGVNRRFSVDCGVVAPPVDEGFKSNIEVPRSIVHVCTKFGANRRFCCVIILVTCWSVSGIVAPPVDESGPHQMPRYLVSPCETVRSLVQVGGFVLKLC